MIQDTITYCCRVCGSTHIVRDGTNKCGQAQYHCKDCGAYRVLEPVTGYSAEWNDFLLPLVLTLSRPDLRTLSVGMYSFRGEYYVDWSGMAAAASIALLPIILVFLAMQWYLLKKAGPSLLKPSP